MNSKITLFRNFIGIFLFVSLFSLSANAQTIVFSEDFADAAAGDNTSSSGSGTVWNGNESFVTDENSKAFQAGGAIKLGTSNLIGYITSVPVNLSQGGGTFTLTFDVKGWSAAGNIKVIITGQPEQIVAYTNTMSGANIGPFETKSITMTGGVANATIRFETLADPASSRRAFIDNVVVTVPTLVNAPVATAATNIDYDSFTANWNTVEGISQYRLDVSTTPDFSTFVGTYNNFFVVGNSQEVTGLTSNTTYYYRVRAVDVDLTSVNSNVIDLTTECGPFVLPDLTSGQYCPGSTIADLPLSGEEGYNWFSSEADTTPIASTDALTHGTTYYLMQTINNCDSEKVPYVVNVVIVEAPVYAEPEIEVCNSGTIADITPDNSGYLFYTDATGGTALAGTTELVNGTTLYVSRVVEGCESTRTEVLIEIEIPLVPAGATTQQFTTGETLADLAVTADEELIWYADASLETELDPTTPLVNDTTYYAVNNDAGCMSEALAVTVQQELSAPAFGLEGLVAYPNPVSTVFTVSYIEPINTVTVYNMLGQVVVSNSSNATTAQVNMSAVSAGTYVVKVVSGSQTATFKVVKQ